MEEVDIDPRAEAQQMLRQRFTRSMLAFIAFRIALQGVGIYAILIWLVTKIGMPAQSQMAIWPLAAVLLALMCGLELFLKYRNTTHRLNAMGEDLHDLHSDAEIEDEPLR